MTCWALMLRILEEGHRATVISLAYPHDTFTPDPERQRLVRDRGAELVIVPVPPDLSGDPRSSLAYLPTHQLQPQVAELLRTAAPDAAFVYHWDSLATTHGIRDVPRLAAVDDLVHLPNLRRWQSERPAPTRAYVLRSWSLLRGLAPQRRSMIMLLNDCAASCAFQADAAAWLRARGAGGCVYAPAPLMDPLPAGARLAADATRNGKPRILLGPSQLRATSTAAGLRLFAREILPRVEQALGREGFDVEVVGEGEPPPELARLLPHPAIHLRGRIEPADEEFSNADVQLVPTPFVLGKRVRIIVGFAFGCCVVAHTAEAVNLPELRDGDNALLGSTGAEIGDGVVRAVRDPELRERLGANARRTYEEHFHPRAAATALVRRLEEIAQRR
jgi:hypothetical protein